MRGLPLVSIVTPTLNQAAFIGATIASIKRQTYGKLEHIVVDGGSTDGTVEILRRHEGTYPMRWWSEPDRGMYDAVNKGLRTARGDILAYLNSDDLYFPWTLEVVVAEFARHPEADFVFGDALGVDDQTGRHEVYWVPPYDLGYVRSFGYLVQPAVFWRRSAYETEGPFDESLRYVADCDYWMRAGVRHRFRKVNEFLAVERNHGATQRQALPAVWAELEAVRARYDDANRARDRDVRRHRVRARLWSRLYWLALLAQALRPRPVRSGPWSRLLNAGTPHVSALRLALMLVPLLGRRQRRQVIEATRAWLEAR